jgi:DNA polymerase
MNQRFKLVGLDFETYGAVSLPDHGLERYVQDPTFQPLIACLWRQDYPGSVEYVDLDLTHNYDWARTQLFGFLEQQDVKIVAHNAGFERAVLRWMGRDYPANWFIDSAVVARAVGAGSSLEAAAPQLLNIDKLELGKQLIKLFSIPGKYQEANGNGFFDRNIVLDHPQEWKDFVRYCRLDAQLGYQIVEKYGELLPRKEQDYWAATMRMNETGWHVDIDTVEEMQRRYLENQAVALEEFRATCAAPDLNLNSFPQLKQWCADRGIRVNSFDEQHVARLKKRLETKLAGMTGYEPKWQGYYEVLQLVNTKQILGGSSLKKLKTILDTEYEGRLKDQYLHIGAGQSWRTTGRSVQMQNLKRIGEPDDMLELQDQDVEWDNDKLARNIRQSFTSRHPSGLLLVGDFSSVENRGLAWAAGETWKVDAFRQGLDLYKVAATKSFAVAYDDVTKDQRQFGKVGELSCGYQAGPEAVQSFASGMGVDLSEGEAAAIVNSFRSANPEIVNFWWWLDEALHLVVEEGYIREWVLPDNMVLRLLPYVAPDSLIQQVEDNPATRGRKIISVKMQVNFDDTSEPFMVRWFHGCYVKGRSIVYYKPTDRKTGDLWKDTFMHPKTKRETDHTIYGGKLAGIFTQSFCRELFMQSMKSLDSWVRNYPKQLELVGQFHDELVVDWIPVAPAPGRLGQYEAMDWMERIMSDPGRVASFPLAAEIKADYRYTK